MPYGFSRSMVLEYKNMRPWFTCDMINIAYGLYCYNGRLDYHLNISGLICDGSNLPSANEQD